jgi:hypothetical protein
MPAQTQTQLGIRLPADLIAAIEPVGPERMQDKRP